MCAVHLPTDIVLQGPPVVPPGLIHFAPLRLHARAFVRSWSALAALDADTSAESKGFEGFEGGVDGASFAAGTVPKGQVSCACGKMPARVEWC